MNGEENELWSNQDVEQGHRLGPSVLIAGNCCTKDDLRGNTENVGDATDFPRFFPVFRRRPRIQMDGQILGNVTPLPGLCECGRDSWKR